MMNCMAQAMQIIIIPITFLIALSFLAFIWVIAILWRRGKTVEALLVWNSLMLYVIALILLLK